MFLKNVLNNVSVGPEQKTTTTFSTLLKILLSHSTFLIDVRKEFMWSKHNNRLSEKVSMLSPIV